MPLRKLLGEQPAHERYVGVYLIHMHFASGHEHLALSVTRVVTSTRNRSRGAAAGSAGVPDIG